MEVARQLRATLKRPTLVVTIKRDVFQWKEEILNQDPTIPVVIGTSDVLWVPEVPDWWLVLHYEAMVRHIKGLSRVQWSTVILDEGHFIKNDIAQRSKAAKKLKAERKIVATGTPIDKTPGDLWSMLEFLYPADFRGRKRAFKNEHERWYIDGAGYRRTLPGARDPQALAMLLAPFTFARTKEEVAPELPPNIHKHVSIQLTGTQAALYKRIATMDDIELHDPELLRDPLFVATKLAQMQKLQQAAVYPELVGSAAESAKLEWLQAWREDNPEEPCIVFTNYRAVAQAVAQMFTSDVHLVMGGVSLPSTWTKRMVVGTIRAASTALDLAHLRTAIFLDTTWSHLLMEQAINRIHRLSSQWVTQTLFLTAVGTVDELMLQAAVDKIDKYELLRRFVETTRGQGR